MRKKLLVAGMVVAAAVAVRSLPAGAAGELPPASTKKIDYVTDIKPILKDNCYSCHSAAQKIKGGLRLDASAALLKGGENGPVIVPGDPDASVLIKAVRYTDADLQMPPKNKKLPAEKIALLEAWVKMGAPDPRQTGRGPRGRSRLTRGHVAASIVRNEACGCRPPGV